jgi:predicted enzyme related to lactoylglutathione lyase
MKIKHVYLTASQPTKLAEFYGKAGLAVRFTDGDRWIQFRSDGAAFCVAGSEESVSKPGSNAIVVFEVGKIEQVVERAVEAGATVISAIRDMGSHGRVAQVRDPEGNSIQFFEASSKPSNG